MKSAMPPAWPFNGESSGEAPLREGQFLLDPVLQPGQIARAAALIAVAVLVVVALGYRPAAAAPVAPGLQIAQLDLNPANRAASEKKNSRARASVTRLRLPPSAPM